jgi:hypothetical protein
VSRRSAEESAAPGFLGTWRLHVSKSPVAGIAPEPAWPAHRVDIVRASMSLDPRRLPLDALLVAGITALITAAPLLPVPLGSRCVCGNCVHHRSRLGTPLPRRGIGGALLRVVWLALVLAGIRYSQITLGAGLVAHAWATRRVAWLQGTAAWMRRGSLGVDVWRSSQP